MLKKTITYQDFNGDTTSEDFYFNLTKAELIELELSAGEEGLTESIKKLIASKDGASIINEFKRIILLAYGRKSEDGRRFIKSEEFRQEFASTEAYSELFFELATNADAAVTFIKGVMPSGLVVEEASLAPAAASVDAASEPKHAPKDPKDMTNEELLKAFREKTIPPAN